MSKARKSVEWSGESGFSLIETLVALGVVSLCVSGMIATLLLVTRPLDDARETANLASVAENVVADLRGVTAYDVDTMNSVAGTSERFALRQPMPNGTPVPFFVSVVYGSQEQAGDPIPVDVTVRDPMGRSITVHHVLVTQAPPPGSVMTPNPAANAALPASKQGFRAY